MIVRLSKLVPAPRNRVNRFSTLEEDGRHRHANESVSDFRRESLKGRARFRRPRRDDATAGLLVERRPPRRVLGTRLLRDVERHRFFLSAGSVRHERAASRAHRCRPLLLRHRRRSHRTDLGKATAKGVLTVEAAATTPRNRSPRAAGRPLPARLGPRLRCGEDAGARRRPRTRECTTRSRAG